jgi:hypothetical protein
LIDPKHKKPSVETESRAPLGIKLLIEVFREYSISKNLKCVLTTLTCLDPINSKTKVFSKIVVFLEVLNKEVWPLFFLKLIKEKS